MAEALHTDGDVGAGARGFLSSIVNNRKLYLGISVCSVGLAAVGWAFVPTLWDKAPLWLAAIATLGAVFLTVLPVLLQYHKSWLDEQLAERDEQEAEQRINEQAELITLFHMFLLPCLDDLRDVATPARGTAALASIRRAIINALRHICGPPGVAVRVVWFAVEGQTLVPDDWLGGECNTNRKFPNRNSDLAGCTAWKVARSGEPTVYHDLRTDPPPGYEPIANTRYQTFMTCGVLGVNKQVVGMLNVDSPEANDFNKIDLRILGFCAKLLGVAYALEGGT